MFLQILEVRFGIREQKEHTDTFRFEINHIDDWTFEIENNWLIFGTYGSGIIGFGKFGRDGAVGSLCLRFEL